MYKWSPKGRGIARSGRTATVRPSGASIPYAQLRKWIIVKKRVAEEAGKHGVSISDRFLIELNEYIYSLVKDCAGRVRQAGRKQLRAGDLEQ